MSICFLFPKFICGCYIMMLPDAERRLLLSYISNCRKNVTNGQFYVIYQVFRSVSTYKSRYFYYFSFFSLELKSHAKPSSTKVYCSQVTLSLFCSIFSHCAREIKFIVGVQMFKLVLTMLVQSHVAALIRTMETLWRVLSNQRMQ